jgi:pyrimidine deaminase RibD-like protein
VRIAAVVVADTGLAANTAAAAVQLLPCRHTKRDPTCCCC